MDKPTSIEQILDGISAVRNLRKGFVTNFYLDYDKHKLWIEKNACSVKKIGDTFFIIKDSDGFCNVFYNSIDYSTLAKDIENLSSETGNKTLVIDFLSKSNQNNEEAQVFKSLDFENVCNLVRMSRVTPQFPYIEAFDKITYARVDQAGEILQLLSKYFDKELEQLPYLEEILHSINLKQVLIYEIHSKIAGFVIFEKNKTTQHLRYWFVCPQYRDKKIGGLLLKKFFYEGNDTKRQILWVVRSNENSLKRYLHYGFKEDGLVDRIFINGIFVPNSLTTNNLNS